MTQQEINRLRDEILEMCRPMLESMVNELKSSTFYDAAIQADRYNNTELAKRFRSAGDEALDREHHTEFENTLDVYREFEVDDVDFVVANYIPAGIDVLICLKNASTALIARVDTERNSLSELSSLEFKTDIASLYKRKPVVKPNVPSIGAVIYKNRNSAKEIASIINSELGCNISWRWFFADKKAKGVAGSSESNYSAQSGTTVDGYHIGIAKRASDQATYSIFYVIVGNEKRSFVMVIYKTLKGDFVFGNQQPGPVYNVIKNAKPDWDMARPTPASSHIQNIYEFFTDPANRRITRMTFNFIAAQIDVRLDVDDIEKAVKMAEAGYGSGQWGSFNTNFEVDEMPPVEELGKKKEDDDMSDFMDV